MSDFTSLSADGTFKDKVLPVPEDTVNQAWFKKFDCILFPKTGKPLMEGGPEYKHFHELYTNVNRIATELATGFAILKGIALHNDEYTSLRDGDPDNFVAYHNARLKKYFAVMGDSDTYGEQVGEFLNMVLNGNSHTIRPSTRYKNGYDIVWVGRPATYRGNSLMGFKDTANINADIDPLSVKTDLSLDRGVSVDALRAAQIITGTLTKDGLSTTNAHKRQFITLPLDFNFRQFNKLGFSQTPGFDRLVKIFPQKLVSDNIPTHLRTAFADFFSIVVCVTPHPHVVEAHASSLKSAVPQPPPVNESLVSGEFLLLEPNLSLSLCLSLPKDLVSFITQTPLNEKPSLAALHSWVNAWKKYAFKPPVRSKGQRKGDRNDYPRYIIKPSTVKYLTDQRRSAQITVEEGRVDTNNMYVSSRGAMSYMLSTSQATDEHAKAHEQSIDAAIEMTAALNMPVDFSSTALDPVYLVENDPSVATAYDNVMRDLRQNAGKLLSYSWDFNTALYADPYDPAKIEAMSLAGSCRPDALAVADYLQKPFAEGMRLAIPTAGCKTKGQDNRYVHNTAAVFGAGAESPTYMVTEVHMFDDMFNLYQVLVEHGKAVNFQALLDKAAAQFKVKRISDDAELDQYESGIYASIVSDDLKDKRPDMADALKVRDMLLAVLKEASAKDASSNHQKALIADNGAAGWREALYDSKRYFDATVTQKIGSDKKPIEDPAVCKMTHFANIYNYVGGTVFRFMLEEIKRNANVIPYRLDFDPAKLPLPTGRLPEFRRVVREILPFAQFATKYIPESEDILLKATELEERNAPNTGIDISDMSIPGGREGAEIFPHHVVAHRQLRNRPRFAAIDVQPGGGKTIMLLMDIACCIKEHQADEKPVVISPLVIAPTGLVKNWVEDMTKIVGNTWNLIPIDSDIVNRWGYERLYDVLKNRPINSVVVVGIDSLTRAGTYNIPLADHLEQSSNVLDLVRSFNFNYVAVDEAHKVKNAQTTMHKMVKQLCGASQVLYIRLASGTLISNEVSDIVGEASIFSSQIFRTVNEYKNEKSLLFGDAAVNVSDKNYNELTRTKLRKHVSLVTIKRKEWAFMLPIPIETFQHPDLDYEKLLASSSPKAKDRVARMKANGELTDDEVKLAALHKQAYRALVEMMASALKNLIKSQLSDDDGKDKDTTKKLDREEAAMDEALNSMLGQYWLQRVDQFLLDPYTDDIANIDLENEENQRLKSERPDAYKQRAIFKEAFDKMRDFGFVPTKVKMVVDLIREHYRVKPWIPNGGYRELDDVDYEGQHYIARKRDLTNHARVRVSNKEQPPDADNGVWKLENRGKILIFCRYNRSVDAILKYLPDDLKKKTVVYYGPQGGRGNKDAMERFRKDPSIQILLANETGILEGHNLQCASRLIRVELPWTPGDLEQAQSRIFRPDPAGYAAGEMERSVIYIDIIASDETLEMNKLARLYAKVLANCQYEEEGNPRYAVLRKVDTDSLRMKCRQEDLMKFIKFDTLDYPDGATEEDMLKTHMGAWDIYVGIRNNEFIQMKAEAAKAGTDKMLALAVEKPLPGFRKMPLVPYVSNQEIDRLDPDLDEHGHNLVKFMDFLTRPSNTHLLKAAQTGPDALFDALSATQPKTIYVHTDMGYGRIVGFASKRNASAIAEGDTTATTASYNLHIANVKVLLAGETNPSNYISVPIPLVYLATTVSRANSAVFINAPSATLASKPPMPTAATIPPGVKPGKRRPLPPGVKPGDTGTQTPPRQAGGPVSNEPATAEPVAPPPPRVPKEIPTGGDQDALIASILRKVHLQSLRPDLNVVVRPPLKIYPAVYNGYLGVEVATASLDDEAPPLLEEYGFKKYGEYAYVRIKYKPDFMAFRYYLKKMVGVVPDPKSVERLDLIKGAFDKDTTNFVASLAPYSSLPHFQFRSHSAPKPGEIRVYPVVSYESSGQGADTKWRENLLLAVDLKTNPVLRRHVGNEIAGYERVVKKVKNGAVEYERTPVTLSRPLKIRKASGFEIALVKDKEAAKKLVSAMVGSNKFAFDKANVQEFLSTLDQMKVKSSK